MRRRHATAVATRQVVLLLLAGGDASRLSPKPQNDFDARTGRGKVWLEQVRAGPPPARYAADEAADPHPGLARVAALPAPRVFKTHAQREVFLGVDYDGSSRSSGEASAAAAEPPLRASGGGDAAAAEPARASGGDGAAAAAAEPAHALLPGVRVVYVTRDAKASAVSSYYHNSNPARIGWPFAAWLLCWAGGRGHTLGAFDSYS